MIDGQKGNVNIRSFHFGVSIAVSMISKELACRGGESIRLAPRGSSLQRGLFYRIFGRNYHFWFCYQFPRLFSHYSFVSDLLVLEKTKATRGNEKRIQKTKFAIKPESKPFK
ncbi:MAG: hypothetical protein ACQEW9_17195 [Bacteroidota bacterium]